MSYIKQLKEEMLEGELIKRQVEEDIEREKLKEKNPESKAKVRQPAATNPSTSSTGDHFFGQIFRVQTFFATNF